MTLERNHSYTTEAIRLAAERSVERIQTYFAGRGTTQHAVGGIQQLVWDAATCMMDAVKGRAYAQKARDPVAYLSKRIQESADNPRLNEMRKWEDRFALELLADELGIKEGLLKTLCSRRSGPG